MGHAAQGSVAGKVTSINGAAFVLGPSIGVGLYEARHALPYLTASAALLLLFGYAWTALRDPLVDALRPVRPELTGGDEPYGLDR